jgi:hypothetical protein
MDAKVWTDEFMATKARLGNKEFDHAMMLSWFANAIMAGFDEANRRAQRALDAEREKVKFGSCEVCWNLAWVLCRDDEPNAVPMKCANGTTYWRCDYCWYKQQLATLQAQLADRDAMILQMGEQAAVLAKENMAVKAQLRQVEEALQERKEFIADCDTALDRIQAPRTNEGQEELVSTWRRIELLGKLLYQYRQELERSAATLAAQDAGKAVSSG